MASKGSSADPVHQRQRRQLTVEQMADGILAGDRAVLGRAITLVESRRAQHQEQAQELLARLLPHTGSAHRVGITGVPGVGKSTFIEALGSHLLAAGRRPAVLAIDPSSTVSGGSILGDKTRMSTLSTDARAFVRPSPSGGTLGGVARKTRESLLLCEAAGFDVVLVETVGVGQSEAMVAGMVDSLLLLLLPRAGDELQGIKRGLLELIDVVAVNKADGEGKTAAGQAREEYASALRLVRSQDLGWSPPVLTASGLHGDGLAEVWQAILDHREALLKDGALTAKRQKQQLRWMWNLLEESLLQGFRDHPRVSGQLASVEEQVLAGELPASKAANLLLRSFLEN